MKGYQESGRRTGIYRDFLAPLFGGESGNKIRLDFQRAHQSLHVDKFLALLNKKTAVASKQVRIYTPPPSVSELLRVWVDEWLDSGKDKTGSENPMWRSFRRAQTCAEAAHSFSQHGRVGLVPYESGLELQFAEYAEPSSESLRPLLGTRNEDYAREQLVFFLLTPLRFMLAKCRKGECGNYFLLSHWNRQYKNGTLCEECKRKRSQTSAKDATARERQTIRCALHNTVAKRFRKEITDNPLWHQSEALKKKIAEFLTAKFDGDESFHSAYPNGLTGKWVANVKNWKPIQTATKEGE